MAINNKPEISVVVPVYNVENYLQRCIDSLLNQSFKSYEIILVDDGSTDSCGEICDSYARKYEFIKAIHKINGGLSSARLKGFEESKGDYICFIDSDDYVSSDILNDWYKAIAESNADMAICSYFIEYGNRKVLKELPFKGVITEIKDQYIDKLLDSPCYLWLRLFKKNIINASDFVSERDYYLEDVLFNIIIAQKIRKIVIVDNANYYFCFREGSLIEKYRTNGWQKMCNLNRFIKKLYKENHIEITPIIKNQLAIKAIKFTIQNAYRLKSFRLFKDDIKNMVETEDYQTIKNDLIINDIGIENRLMIKMLDLKLFFFIYSFYAMHRFFS